MMFRVTCPCCKGRKWLIMHGTGLMYGAGVGVDIEHAYSCTHCQGEGEVDAEVPEYIEPRVVPRYDAS